MPLAAAVIVLCSTSLVQAESDHSIVQVEKPPVLFSYRNFKPLPQAFPQTLAPLVERIAKATTIKDKVKDKNTNEKEFQAIVANIKKRLETANRGYRDELFFLLGFSYEQIERDTKALQAYKTSLHLRANNPVALYRSAHLLKKTKQFEQAIRTLKELSWWNSDSKYEVLFAIAECQLKLQQYEKALANLELVETLNPDFTPAAELLIAARLSLLEQGIEDEALRKNLEAKIVTALKALLKRVPSKRKYIILLARILLRTSDPLFDASEILLTEKMLKGLVEKSSGTDTEAVKLLFEAQLKQGKSAEAKTTLEQGLAKRPMSPTLAQAKKQMEINDQAIQTIQKKQEENEDDANK